ncbi:MAG: hypothetical protein WCO54_03645 [Bacteroidota bacterium]
MSDFFKSSDAERLKWVANFKTQVALLGASVGLTAAQITESQGWCDDVTNALNAKAAKKNEYAQAVNFADIVIADKSQNFHSIANIIKVDPGYNDGTGTSLGIINTPDAPIDPATFKPIITLSLGNGYVIVKYTKKGVVGVNIYSRIKGTADWTHLILSTHSPYHDYHPLAAAGVPEMREYMVIGVQNDAEIGVPSDIASITYAG